MKIVLLKELNKQEDLPWHGNVVECEVIEKRLARDCRKLRGEVHQLSLRDGIMIDDN